MTLMIWIFLLVGLAGLAGATLLPGLLAAVVSRIRPIPRPAAAAHSDRPVSLQILVTAHNEEGTVTDTLHSLVEAVAGSALPAPAIVVGLDHCTDQTEAVVQAFAKSSAVPISCQHKQGTVGKWRMLVELVRAAQADWIALVDCGSRWDRRLLEHATPHLQSKEVQAVSPSYMPHKAGLLERLHWRLEQAIRALEMHSGGPISVHGATVFYRRSTLLAALARLEDREWLNDDLVLPLVIRMLNPSHRVVYMHFSDPALAYVVDRGLKPAATVEYRRRQRIMHGYVQWLQLLVAQRCFRQPVIALHVSRRVCRMLWSYWVSLIALGVILTGIGLVGVPVWFAGLSLVAFALVMTSSNFVRRLCMAYFSALITPLHLIRRHVAGPDQESIAWQ